MEPYLTLLYIRCGVVSVTAHHTPSAAGLQLLKANHAIHRRQQRNGSGRARHLCEHSSSMQSRLQL